MSNNKRAVAIVDQDPELKKLDEKLDSAAKSFKEKRMFLEKQIEEAHRQTIKPVWDEIGALLVSRGVIETYDKATDSLQLRDGVLFYEKRSSDGGSNTNHPALPDFLKGLFGLND